MLTRASIAFTAVSSVFLGRDLLAVLAERLRTGSVAGTLEQVAFIAIAASLLYGNFVYQVARLGFLERRRQLGRVPVSELEAVFDSGAPSVVLLVPSYREEPRLVRQTLLSAALQDHPRRRVVLLIDDPPAPDDAESLALLRAARRLPEEIRKLLEKPAKRFAAELADFYRRAREDALDLREETLRLAALYAEAAAWFEAQASNEPEHDHTDRLFAELVLRAPARAHLRRTLALEDAARTRPLARPQLRREYRHLAALFRVEITSFERKRYVNLSHEPNKAMNLNAYLGLLGQRFREEQRPDGRHLVPAGEHRASLDVPDAEFVITLDADSLLTRRYALRLVHELCRPGHERVAVAQTPYTAVPGAPGLVERVAGATTDIQYVIHQGFTRHRATYWVGANAVLRHSAIAELRSTRRERGHEVPCFIQDRTTIEDTESSIDLAARGWTLHNHPERLAYSATPPDFGALVIQRRRWANGGLLVLPKLIRMLLQGPSRRGRLGEAALRCHYLVSIACVNVSLLALLLHPFDGAMRAWWFPAAALPYFTLYGRDLVACGYRPVDLVRVYALNLLLLPVNLGGVTKSLRQAVTGRKSAFGRTPKVQSRTAVAPLYLLSEWVLLVLLGMVLVADLERRLWVHVLFVVANGGLLLWAVLRLIGVSECVEDLRVQLGRRWQRARARASSARTPRWPAVALALGATLASWGLCEAAFWAANAWRDSRVESFVAREYYQPDPTLGYGPERGFATRAWKRIDGKTLYDVRYEIDALGRRVTPVVGLEGRDRFLLFFGCSFTFGEGVEAGDTLPAAVARGAPRYAPYNYAFHGYGPNQLLAKLESGTLRGEVSQSDGVLVYPLIGAHVSRAIGSLIVTTRWAKDAPYYELDADGTPVRRGTFTTGRPWTSLAYALLGRSQVLRFLDFDLPLEVGDRDIELTARIVARSAELFRESFGPQRFVVVIYPETWPSATASRLGPALAREGIEVLDYSSLFGADRSGFFFPEDRHPNARAHDTVAKQLVLDLGLAEPR